MKRIDEELIFASRMFDEFLIATTGLVVTSIKMKIAKKVDVQLMKFSTNFEIGLVTPVFSDLKDQESSLTIKS